MLLLAGAGCGSDDEAPVPSAEGDAGPGETRDAATSTDAGPNDAGTAPRPFGLDERPRNTTCRAPPRPEAPTPGVRLEPVFRSAEDLERPLALHPLPGAGDTFWLIQQTGRIWAITEAQAPAPIADLSARVDDEPNEGGLLGLAFHPRFLENGRVFVAYTARDQGEFVSRLSEFSSPNRNDLEMGSETVVHQVAQPRGNHNGGAIAFGPDDYLYYALGDGGGGGDPEENGQNPDTVLGTILRLDVDSETPYGIPPDNPFASGGGAPEIFAWGFRNPWRFSFDRGSGDLWAGDVGQNAIEEVDLVTIGGNYGWNIKEGTQCFGSSSDCQDEGLIDPVVEYPHSEGRSITGGYVYRGFALPNLQGAYIYGDFVSGGMWAARIDPDTGEGRAERLLDTGLAIASFAEDNQGELYILNYSGGIYRLQADTAPPSAEFPQRLSETGCLNPQDPRESVPGLIPYAPNAPLWSDGAEKRRYLALPEGSSIDVDDEGDFDLPVGTVLVKAFILDDTFVETRLFVRHDDGGWAGYSYAWNEAQTDAELVDGPLRVSWGDREWTHPTRAQCLACHTEAAGRSLGLEVGQLDGDFDYPRTGRTANQLATWTHIGLFSEPLPVGPSRSPRLPSYEEPAPVDQRAKAWLHTNCSVCHRPGGPGRGSMDLRFQSSLADMAICDVDVVHGDLGLTDARRLLPGDPQRSMLLERSVRLDGGRMPPLASFRVDMVGTDLLRSWIRELEGCP